MTTLLQPWTRWISEVLRATAWVCPVTSVLPIRTRRSTSSSGTGKTRGSLSIGILYSIKIILTAESIILPTPDSCSSYLEKRFKLEIKIKMPLNTIAFNLICKKCNFCWKFKNIFPFIAKYQNRHLHKNVGIDPQNTRKEQTGISLIALNSSFQLRCQGIFVESWNALERRISIWRESLLRPHSESAALVVERIKKSEAGIYRCRVDFKSAPTRNTLVNVSLLGEKTRLA